MTAAPILKFEGSTSAFLDSTGFITGYQVAINTFTVTDGITATVRTGSGAYVLIFDDGTVEGWASAAAQYGDFLFPSGKTDDYGNPRLALKHVQPPPASGLIAVDNDFNPIATSFSLSGTDMKDDLFRTTFGLHFGDTENLYDLSVNFGFDPQGSQAQNYATILNTPNMETQTADIVPEPSSLFRRAAALSRRPGPPAGVRANSPPTVMTTPGPDSLRGPQKGGIVKLTRRSFMQQSALVGAGFAVAGRRLLAHPRGPWRLTKFVAPLPNVTGGAYDIPVASPNKALYNQTGATADYYRIVMGQYRQALHPELPNVAAVGIRGCDQRPSEVALPRSGHRRNEGPARPYLVRQPAALRPPAAGRPDDSGRRDGSAREPRGRAPARRLRAVAQRRRAVPLGRAKRGARAVGPQVAAGPPRAA